MNKRISESLRLQLLCAVMISLCIGLIVFGISFLLGNTILDKTVYGRSFEKTITDQKIAELQNYVSEQGISKENIQKLNQWCYRNEKMYLTIYDAGTLIYGSHISEADQAEGDIKFDPELEDPQYEYVLVLKGNKKVSVFLYYYAGYAFYFFILLLSGILAFLTFASCFVLSINQKLEYIRKLKQELDILAGGQLEFPITVIGNDELGDLAVGIDQMRCSILKHQEKEKQMRSANSDLITAMSHDLRTPLTALLAYLELIERRKYENEAQLYNLVQKSVGQTVRIKRMADKLFAYFMAYSTEWENAEMEFVDADQFFYQILEDYAYALESKGLYVELEQGSLEAGINVNIELLQRMMDNLYSNLIKYADPKETLYMSYQRQEDTCILSISNGIRLEEYKEESSRIGLITCQRIVEYHGGRFTAKEENRRFYVTIQLPLEK